LLGVLAVSACARGSATTNARPADFYAASPSIADIRQLFGDNSWWALPPRFGVHPLNADRMPVAINYQVSQTFAHVGTAELLRIAYYVFDSTSTASTVMSNLQTASGAGASGTKLGDQSLYYGQMNAGSAAPYVALAYVRIGSSVTEATWSRKDAYPTVSALSLVAKKASSRVKDVMAGKVRASPQASGDLSQLPPPGMNMTLLGSARISVESSVLGFGVATAPQQLVDQLRQAGVSTVLYGDYVLNADTHMEVRTMLMEFSTSDFAAQWVDILRGTTPLDGAGIYSDYSDVSGTYFFAFSTGTKAAVLTCAASGPSEAASRACESPVYRETTGWKIGLGG